MAGIQLALNFDLGAAIPLDSRIVVAQFNQLNNISQKYSGMQVYAADTKKLYYLEDPAINKWTEVITNSNLPSLPTSLVYTTGNQTIGGEKTFSSRPKVGVSGVLLQGEIPSLPTTILYTTGSQDIEGEKTFKFPTNFTNSILIDTNRWLVDQFFTGFSGDDTNWSSFAASIDTNNEGTLLFVKSNTSVYVYTRNSIEEDWSVSDKFVLSGTIINSLHFNNNTSTLFVSASQNSGGYITGENVYIFTGSRTNGWNNLYKTITGYSLPPLSNGQAFGASIKTNEANDILVLGANRDDDKGTDAGAVFIYTGSSQNDWSLKQKIVPPGSNLNFQYFGIHFDLSANGDVLFVTNGGDINQNKIYIYTGSKTSPYVLKQNIDMPMGANIWPWGQRYDFISSISCNSDASKFVFTKSKELQSNLSYLNIYTGNKNIGWSLNTEIESIGTYNFLSNAVLNKDGNVIILGDPSFAGALGLVSIYTINPLNNNWRLSEIIQPNTFPFIWPNGPAPTRGIRMGGGYFGSDITLNDDASFVGVGASQAPIVQNGSFRGCFVCFNLTQQSVYVNSQEPNASLLNITGQIDIFGQKPRFNNTGILIKGEAIEPDSNAQLKSLQFKSNFFNTEVGPRLIPGFKGSGMPESLRIYSDFSNFGDIVEFTETGVDFTIRPTVNGSGVLLQGESAGGVSPELTNVVFTTGDQTINGNKNFSSRPTVNNANIVLQGETLDSFFGGRPIRRLPSVDVNYGGNTISGFLANLFFPYLNTTITLNNFNIYTYGVDSLSNINFSSNITSNDDIVTGIAAFRGLSRIAGIDPISVNGTQTITQNAILSPSIVSTTSNYLSRVYITRSGSSTNIPSSIQFIRFEPRYYFGLSANTSLNSGQIAQLQNIVGPNTNPSFYNYTLNTKPTSITATFNNPVNQYLYLAYPGEEISTDFIKDWGSITSIVDTVTFQQYTNEFEPLTNVQINLGTKVLTYRVHRSKLPWNINASFSLRFNL